MSNCFFCKGKTEVRNVNVDFRWKDKLFVVKNVPLEVCSQCGEKYYSAQISKKLDEFVKKQAEAKIRVQETIQVPVLNWQ
ncbi:hypothetical protein A3A60_00570 [Candidatus Curtissbacteria bacterium RIFCSPLOWO2_01_FULL_42_26]|uniref:YgiT-type zinc finger domain-containing protein n=1 Tax=Candidatus Curtissbacteria bacterium RIFCSPLOWO2_01_FULL_42_26 TaxID=1797729 RepID=A0A1F5I168_9BACT|nr:MAG: hypothetical protein A3A60_00570 [Candidatus Curtissbacteria bacterium RIFCSPLOWO2_01_FULL_42_26]